MFLSIISIAVINITDVSGYYGECTTEVIYYVKFPRKHMILRATVNDIGYREWSVTTNNAAKRQQKSSVYHLLEVVECLRHRCRIIILTFIMNTYLKNII